MVLFVPAAVATKPELNAAASPIPMVPSRSSSGPRDGGAAAWRRSSSPWPEMPQLGEGAWKGSGSAAAVTMARSVRELVTTGNGVSGGLSWPCSVNLRMNLEKGFLQQSTGNEDAKKHYRVAMYLSKYCAYLVASAPGLLPGRSDTTKRAMYAGVRKVAIWSVHEFGDRLMSMEDFDKFRQEFEEEEPWIRISSTSSKHGYLAGSSIYAAGVKLGDGLHTSMPAADRWKLLAKFWVKALLYAGPSDKVEEHLQHLSQGGELITHLWALLYHAVIHEWRLDLPPQQGINMGWDYIFRIRSWEDLDLDSNHHQKSPESQYRAGDAAADITEMMTDDARRLADGASSSSRPTPPPAP